MENFLINYLLKNCVTLAKEFFSSEKVTPQEGDNALNFLNILDVKMGSGIATSNTNITKSNTALTASNTDVIDGTASKGEENETSGESITKEDDAKESPLNFFDTQSILSLLQTYFNTQDIAENIVNLLEKNATQDIQDNTLNTLQGNTQSITIEKFLRNIFSLLREGESVQFLKEKSMGTISLVQASKEQETAVATDQSPVVAPQKAMENSALISYLVSVLQDFDVSEKTVGKIENTETGNKDVSVNEYEKPQNVEILKMFGTAVANKETAKVTDKSVKPLLNQLLNQIEMPVSLENEDNVNKDVLNRADATGKPFPNIEVRKLNDKENVIQIISNESSSRESEEINKNISVLTVKTGKPSFSQENNLPESTSSQSLSGQSEEMNKNISVLTAKTEKAALSRDDEVVGIVSKISDKTANERAGLDGRQLLSQNDYTKTSLHIDRENGKVSEKTPFASVMSDRIEKIVEQYANKSVSMDMIVRLRIDDKETLLVGLKEQGQRVTVEVKTTNESMGSFLQSQKEEIARQLEGKNVYANIYVDVQNENSQKREQKNNQKKRSDDQEQKDFGGFLDAVA